MVTILWFAIKTVFSNIHTFIYSLLESWIFFYVTSAVTIIRRYPVSKEIVYLMFLICEGGGQKGPSGQGRKSHPFSCHYSTCFLSIKNSIHFYIRYWYIWEEPCTETTFSNIVFNNFEGKYSCWKS